MNDLRQIMLVASMAVLTLCHGAEYIPQSGEHVVIGDFEYVLVSTGDWQRWTNCVARLEAVAERRWKKEHETVDGRRFWHGSCTGRVVSAESKTVTWLYLDGYKYVDDMPKATRSGPPKKIARPVTSRPPIPTALPARLRAKREIIKAQPAAKDVNVTFGAGGKVLKVEGGK